VCALCGSPSAGRDCGISFTAPDIRSGCRQPAQRRRSLLAAGEGRCCSASISSGLTRRAPTRRCGVSQSPGCRAWHPAILNGPSPILDQADRNHHERQRVVTYLLAEQQWMPFKQPRDVNKAMSFSTAGAPCRLLRRVALRRGASS